MQQRPQRNGQHRLQHAQQPADDDDQENHVGHRWQHDAEHERHGFHVLPGQLDVVGGYGKHPVPEGFCALFRHLVGAGNPAYQSRAETAQECSCLETGIENVQAKTAGGHGVTDAFHPVDGATDAAVVAAEHLCVVLAGRTIAVCAPWPFR